MRVAKGQNNRFEDRPLQQTKPRRRASRQIVGTPTNRRKARRYKSKSGCTTRPALRGDGEDAEGAAGAVDDFEGGGDDHGAGGGQLIEIAKAGEAKLSASVHDVVV